MRRLSVLAVVVGLVGASCSGHGGGTLPPARAAAGSPAATLGAHNTRAKTGLVAPVGWAVTATSAMTLANATDLGQLDGTKPVAIALGLQMRDPEGAKAAVAAGQRLSRDAFVSRFGPSADQVAAAVGYLRAQGFSNVTAAPNNLLVTASAPAATVEKAFATTLHGFGLAGTSGTYYANTQPAFVPAALGGNVVAVLGLTNVPGVKAAPARKSSPGVTPGIFDGSGTPSPTACTQNLNTVTGTPVCPRFYDPASFAIAYHAGTTPAATNTGIGIFAVGDPSGAIADFRDNEARFGLPQVPVNVLHAGPASSDASGNGEWTLDLTYSQGMAYDAARIDLYTATSFSFKDLTVAINAWAADDSDPVLNASVGGCEAFPYQSGDMVVGDMILIEAAAQGQTMFASTGDTGGYCGVSGVPPNGGVGGVPMVEYPASSPYAVAVGGTDLFSNVDGTYLGEQSWQSGGGGLSQFEYSPSWESPAQPVGTTPVGFTFRGLPDVAFDAALETGALLYQGGAQYITGGTSLASPMAAGIYARMQSAQGNALGFAAPLLYRVYAASTPQSIAGPPETERIGPFHDILQGTNGLYTALPKYDYTTGLGSLDIARLALALQ